MARSKRPPKPLTTCLRAREKCMAPSPAPAAKKWTAPWLRPSMHFPCGRRRQSGNAPPVSTDSPMLCGTTPPCWPRPRRRTMENPCLWPHRWTSLGRKKTFGFTPRASSITPARAMPWKAKPSTTPCGSPLAWWRASVLGTCPCTCSRGKWRPHWPQGIVWWPNPLSSPPSPPIS